MLERGGAGSAGVEDVLPVLRGGAVVAQLRESDREGAATAVVGEREWGLAEQGREPTGRWSADPEGTPRSRARRTPVWEGDREADPAGTPVAVSRASVWRSTHRAAVAAGVGAAVIGGSS